MHSTASLDKFAKIVTVFVLLLSLFFLYLLITAESPKEKISAFSGGLLLLGIIFFTFRNTIHGYSIKDGNLVIERQKGPKKIQLNTLTKVEFLGGKGSGFTFRSFGNGGLFGYFGYFYNNKVGNFRMYSTKRNNIYLLYLKDQIIGITPDQDEFIVALKGYLPDSKKN